MIFGELSGGVLGRGKVDLLTFESGLVDRIINDVLSVQDNHRCYAQHLRENQILHIFLGLPKRQLINYLRKNAGEFNYEVKDSLTGEILHKNSIRRYISTRQPGMIYEHEDGEMFLVE